MSARSSIQWTDTTWNPVTGCTKVSEGCRNCYAERLSERFGRDFSQVVIHQDRLDAPLHWKKPRRIFVNSMSDLLKDRKGGDMAEWPEDLRVREFPDRQLMVTP